MRSPGDDGDRLVLTSTALARAYFATQAVAGALWWVAVFVSDDVERWTLGGLDRKALVVPDLLLFAGASGLAAALASRFWSAVAAIWTVAVTVALGVYGLIQHEAGSGVLLMAAATVATLIATSTLWLGGLPTHWFFVGPFRFRVADDRSGARHLRRSLAQLVVFWSTFFLLVPAVFVVVERRLDVSWPTLQQPGWAAVGWTVFLGASAIGLWSCVTMALLGHGTPLPAETARELVVAGPYRFVRNPMAVAGALQTTAVGFLFGSWLVVVIAVGGAVAWNVVIRPGEEADLAARFGPAYDQYRSRVRCWIPRWPHGAPSSGA